EITKKNYVCGKKSCTYAVEIILSCQTAASSEDSVEEEISEYGISEEEAKRKYVKIVLWIELLIVLLPVTDEIISYDACTILPEQGRVDFSGLPEIHRQSIVTQWVKVVIRHLILNPNWTVYSFNISTRTPNSLLIDNQIQNVDGAPMNVAPATVNTSARH
ncbi:hypothetical protein AVEN_119875-1, partial [Araneus ventricosus]